MSHAIPRLTATAVAALLMLTGCETTIPASDHTAPVVTLTVNDGGSRVAASSDPSAAVQTGCPPGKTATPAELNAYVLSQYGAAVSLTASTVFFYRAGTPPFKIIATTSDAGGAALTRVGFNDETARTTPGGSIAITALTPAAARTFTTSETRDSGNTYWYRIVEHTGQRSDPRTALITTFTASALGSNPLISIRGEDFSGNSAYALTWMLPASLCH